MITTEAIKEIVVYTGTQKRRWAGYQEVCHKGQVLYPGMRDIYERFSLIDLADLKGRMVLDFGCNIGMNCQIAIEFGAIQALGVDYEDYLIETAIQLNTLYKTNCHFAQVDLSRPMETKGFDTGFVFAINHHVKNDQMLAENIKKNIKNVVYFETHMNKRFLCIPEEIEALFKQVDLIGKTDKHRRNFYRCIL